MRAHTLARTHAYARTRCARDGLRQFFSVASDAPALVTCLVATLLWFLTQMQWNTEKV
jgi:hypothetical protein